MSAPDGQLGVVHLVRRANGIEPFASFIESYRRHPAAAPHELVLVLKGFDDEASSEPYRLLASDLSPRWLKVADDGFDLGSYCRAARELTYSRLLFLNSFSVIRADGWLELMRSIAERSGAGAVGASGSWASHSSRMRYELGLGGPYRRVFSNRQATQGAFAALAPYKGPPPPPSGPLIRARQLIMYSRGFPAFPSPHLRSNCMLVDREAWLRVCLSDPPNKFTAHRFESGRGGMTARLEAMGLHVLVAGRDGRAYEVREWPASRTLWQGNQENLLVEDNQTRLYQNGSAEQRRLLSRYAWGAQADPADAPLQEAA